MREDFRESAGIISQAWPDWELRDTIGTGAFATVFRASRRERIPGEKDSAIKIIRIPHDDTDWDRMLAEGKTPEQAKAFFQGIVEDSLKEIRAMEELSGHTNIVNIFDYKRYHVPDKNVWYILIRMELLEKVDTGKLDEKEIIRLGTDVCTALSICRKKNIVHRDVSLDNIFIRDGSYKLGDFGVAKVLEGTMSGFQSIAGKPLYMAPEIYNATLTETDMDAAARVDIYSLGILLYRLTHHMNYPFEDPDTPNIPASERSNAFRRRVIEGEMLPPPKYASPELAEIILKACMANPSKRYDNVNHMRDDLQALTAARLPQPAPRKNTAWHSFSPQKKRILIAAAAALLLALAAGIFFLSRNSGTNPGSENGITETADEIPGLETGMYHIVLSARDMGVVDFFTTKDMLDERLEIFTRDRGGFQSGANDREGRIDLLISREAFDGLDVENVLRACLIRPTVLYAMNQRNHLSHVEIKRDQLESVTLREGAIPGIEPADDGTAFPSGPYIEVVVSDAFAAAYGSEMMSWDKLIFVMDYEQYRNQTWYYFEDVIAAGDGKTFYLIPTDLAPQFSELLCHNLQTEPLPDAMDYEIDLNYLTSWQKTKNTARPGRYQCDFQDVPEASVTVQYYTFSREREGQTLDIENELKSRLDILGTPYAFGIAHGKNNSYFSVKIPAGRMGTPLMESLTASRMVFQSGMLQYHCDFREMQIDLQDDGCGFIISVPDQQTGYFQELAEEARRHDGYVYFSFSEYTPPLFAFAADDMPGDGTIHVNYYCEAREGRPVVYPLDPDHAWLSFFTKELMLHTDYISLPQLKAWQINTAPGAAFLSGSSLAITNRMDKEGLEKKVKEICPAAFMILKRSTLSIYLNLSIDETFPDKTPVMVKNIYEAIGFEDLLVDGMEIYLFDTEYPYDAYFTFYKRERNIEYGNTDNSGYIYTAGNFSNERLAPYREKIVEAIESMAFYQNLTHADTKWIITREQQPE